MVGKCWGEKTDLPLLVVMSRWFGTVEDKKSNKTDLWWALLLFLRLGLRVYKKMEWNRINKL